MSSTQQIKDQMDAFLAEDTKFMIENDMNSWNFYSLDIRPRRSTSHWHHSEFDLNYEKYGYRFNENDLYNWIRGDITRSQVEQLSVESNNHSYKHKKIAAWEVGLLANYTDTMSELLNKRCIEFDYSPFIYESNKFLQGYIKKNV